MLRARGCRNHTSLVQPRRLRCARRRFEQCGPNTQDGGCRTVLVRRANAPANEDIMKDCRVWSVVLRGSRRAQGPRSRVLLYVRVDGMSSCGERVASGRQTNHRKGSSILCVGPRSARRVFCGRPCLGLPPAGREQQDIQRERNAGDAFASRQRMRHEAYRASSARGLKASGSEKRSTRRQPSTHAASWARAA